jgi:hypothetical protein
MSQSIGHGSLFEIDALTNGTFTPIAGVLDISFGSNKVDAHDNTAMDTTGTSRTFLGGLENPGDVTVKVNVKPGDTSQALLASCKDGLLRHMKAIYPGAVRTKAFDGIILSVDESIPDDKLPTYSVKIQITGPVTIT